MSSIAHCRIRTIDKDCLIKAAKDLDVSVETVGNLIKVKDSRVEFSFTDDNVDVSYWDDVKSASKKAKNLAQLSTYYTMSKRLGKSGMRMKTSVRDAVLAVRSNQKLTLEFTEADEQVAVKA